MRESAKWRWTDRQPCKKCGTEIGRRFVSGECYVHTATGLSTCPTGGTCASGLGYGEVKKKKRTNSK